MEEPPGEHVDSVRQQGHEWQDDQNDPGLAALQHRKVLAVNLWLEHLGDWRCIAYDNAEVVKQEAGNVGDPCDPVPIHGLEEQFADDHVHDESESDSAREPVRLCLSCGVSRSGKTLKNQAKSEKWMKLT